MTNTETIKILTEVSRAVKEELRLGLGCPSFLCSIAHELFGKRESLMIQAMLKQDGIRLDGSGFSKNHPIWDDLLVFRIPTITCKNLRRIHWLEYRISLITDQDNLI